MRIGFKWEKQPGAVQKVEDSPFTFLKSNDSIKE